MAAAAILKIFLFICLFIYFIYLFYLFILFILFYFIFIYLFIYLFFASSLEPKYQLTRNLVGSIGVTCR